MKKAITVRLDPELLAEVRLIAERENRTVTNFIATALKDRIRVSPQISIQPQIGIGK